MKVGILCEDYKLETFENKLKEEKFTFKTMFFQDGIKQIHIECEKKDEATIRKICEEVQSSFKKK